MGYQFDEFKAYVKWRLGSRTDLEATTDATKNLFSLWVNRGYKELTSKFRFWDNSLEFEFPALMVDDGGSDTTDGTAYISAPTDAIYIQDCWDSTNDQMCDYIGWETYLQKSGRADTSQENPPLFWHGIRGTYTYLNPTPDDEYTVYQYYRKRPVDLTGVEETVIGEEWDSLILELACYHGFLWLRDYEGADACKNEFLRSATEQLGMYLPRQRAGRRRIKMSSLFTHGYKPKH